MKVRPLGDKILIQRDEAQTKTDTGLYLPQGAKETPRTGVVKAIGQGRLNKDEGTYTPFTVKKGDRVLFTSYAGTEVKIDGQEYLLMTEDSILALVD